MEGWVFPFFSFVIFPRHPSPSAVVLFLPVFDTILLLVFVPDLATAAPAPAAASSLLSDISISFRSFFDTSKHLKQKLPFRSLTHIHPSTSTHDQYLLAKHLSTSS
jgi:hypothetical protein